MYINRLPSTCTGPEQKQSTRGCYVLQIEFCFIIQCQGGGNRIYYQWLAWHTDTILLGILSSGAGAGVIISVIMRPECQGTRGPMIISDAVTSPSSEPEPEQLGLIRKLHYTPITSQRLYNYGEYIETLHTCKH